MKRKITLRIFFIGSLHMILYLYIVPFIVYPKFGKNGITFVVALAIMISIGVLGTLFFERKNKGDGNDK
ncbi:MAG: hypothetical protein A2328_05725 [Bdellovibrionales bacterium RIFOXYB2_FULL_36_6]|nr:MAG: hypothetical protein A2328_05725 [Bdellovibrionales bacterium RIFOXYB2_FULL_36_6]